jgi:hypothetical protein
MLHVCYCGHWQHPPYPIWHWLIDASWVSSFTAAAWIGIYRSEPSKAGTSVLLIAIIFSRLLGVGMTIIFLEMPVAFVLFLIALARLVRELIGPDR